ncbi:beta-galactosidase [Schaalia sp. Marseille-Q2122]|uniref:beta-galactosidase n=1 Tax=Schaalia sp. Marseille-Q2122 TaxID=2736604 RepID=UPI0020CA81F4|nr:beta-galactosidase [Schaalia sp. Marseille-Q2122]
MTSVPASPASTHAASHSTASPSSAEPSGTLSAAARLVERLGGLAYGGDYNPEQWVDARNWPALPETPTTSIHEADAVPPTNTPSTVAPSPSVRWQSTTFDEDLALMMEAKVNLVSLGIFSWARLEPREGHYDFEWLASIIDRLYEHGIYVDLATGTASPPAWMAHEHPEILPVSAEGVRLGFGSRQHTCLSSPYLRERNRALAAALAQRFGDHPGVVMWHIGNEYGCHVRECFCATCSEAFRSWLSARYASIDALNTAWGTAFWSQTYTTFEQVTPPGAMPTFRNPSQVLDWRRFCDAQLRSMMAEEAAAIRAHSPLPVTTNFMGSFPWLNYRAWAEHLDIITNDLYPDPADPAAAWEIAWNGDLMRGLAGGDNWLLMEQAPSAVQWRPRNSPKRPGNFLLWSLCSVARGSQGALQFQWRQSARGSEAFHSGMVPHAGRLSPTWQAVTDTGEALARLGRAADQRVVSQVGIVVDWESEWARRASIGPAAEDEPFSQARAWHRSLWEAGITADIIGVEDALDAYSLVIVPALFIDYPDFTRACERAVARGAQVLVTGPSGVVDSTLGAKLGGYLGSWRSVLGVQVVEHAALTGPVNPLSDRDALTARISRAVSTPAAEEWVGLEPLAAPLLRARDALGKPAPDLRGGRWVEDVRPYSGASAGGAQQNPGQTGTGGIVQAPAHFALWPQPGTAAATAATVDGLAASATTVEASSAEVIAAFDGRGGGADMVGNAAITRAAVQGGGAAWYAATDCDAVTRQALLTVLCAYARVRPTIPALPDGVEAVKRGTVTFIVNHSDRAAELSGVIGTDLLTGAQCTGHVVVAPRSAVVVEATGK